MPSGLGPICTCRGLYSRTCILLYLFPTPVNPLSLKTDQGIKNILAADAGVLAGSDPDYSIRDLYEAIAKGNYVSRIQQIHCPSACVYTCVYENMNVDRNALYMFIYL